MDNRRKGDEEGRSRTGHQEKVVKDRGQVQRHHDNGKGEDRGAASKWCQESQKRQFLNGGTVGGWKMSEKNRFSIRRVRVEEGKLPTVDP